MARCRQDEQIWWVDDLGTFRAVDHNSDDLWRSQPIGDDERSHRLAFRLMRLVKVMEGGRHLTAQWDACWVDPTALQAVADYVRRRHRELRAVHLRYCVGAWVDESHFKGSLAATRMEQILGLRGATPFLGTTVLERPLERLAHASRPLRHGFEVWRRLCWEGRLPPVDRLLDALAPDLRFSNAERTPMVFWHGERGLPSWQVTTEDLWDAFLADLPGHLGQTLTGRLRKHLLEQQTPRLDTSACPSPGPRKKPTGSASSG
ncbi:MAG: hypothetical protein WD341_08950 [Tistlia sp.]|uniref:hypothetical protein n=1 Tax=Tistlia sp. TaxID=3057121 RepID=UPI0034A1A80A